MRILKWLGKHKIWAFFIVVFGLYIIIAISHAIAHVPYDSMAYGKTIGMLFWPYILVVWLYSVIKKKIVVR